MKTREGVEIVTDVKEIFRSRKLKVNVNNVHS